MGATHCPVLIINLYSYSFLCFHIRSDHINAILFPTQAVPITPLGGLIVERFSVRDFAANHPIQ